MNRTEMLAVYGTLKRGFENHNLIVNAQFLGCDSLSQISLFDIGPYPGAHLEASSGIEVEVYMLSARELALLDLLEEYDPTDPAHSLYTRERVETRFGTAWVYLYQGEVHGKPCLRSGAWRPQQHNPAN